MVPTAPSSCDVLVIGGGPAGSTAAAILAERGFKVVLLEKARHPRFHIGESLLPANLPLFERLGVASQVRAIGMEKWAAEFVSPSDGRRQEFKFAGCWDKSMPFAYHVRRSEFDEILIRRAAALGAQVIEGCRAKDVEFVADGRSARVDASLEDGRICSWQARYVIACTPSGATRSTTVRRSMRISRAPEGMPASARGTSRFSGSSTAGFGSFPWPTARRASARSYGRIA
jgi:flavin-dependent dehydrogenase